MKRLGRSFISCCFLLATLLTLSFASPTGAQTRCGSATLGVEQDIAGFDPLIVGVYDTGQEATQSSYSKL
jgi:4-phytase/acid phosphatase/peptide/nickel transport system substrate-binding protein